MDQPALSLSVDQCALAINDPVTSSPLSFLGPLLKANQGRLKLGFNLGSPAGLPPPSPPRRDSTHVDIFRGAAIGRDASLAPAPSAPTSPRQLSAALRSSVEGEPHCTLMTSLDGARRRSQCGPHHSSLWELPQRSF
ncbi:hypothetical protein GBF38_005739 [Nibea albiflora]|uniref:Uncharacterized protein n=1 Tax=Nibea albiflora TaxID=240163 RepID=A0ACB7FB01_NIBAL|nr:hypothetical protein GBF38_005739 [Nibea albiflora]